MSLGYLRVRSIPLLVDSKEHSELPWHTYDPEIHRRGCLRPDALSAKGEN